jgi:hypothetical protein
MNKKAKNSFLKGLMVLFILSIVVAIYLDTKSDIKISTNSQINAPSYFIGLDYSGIITQQLIEKGETVETGQPLIYIKSSDLLEDLKAGRVQQDDLLFPVSENNEIIVRATKDGVVEEINFTLGSFVAANQSIMTIRATGTPFVKSVFELEKDDFERLDDQSRLEVVLPNGTRVTSPISLINVDQENDIPGPAVKVIIESSIEPNANLIIGAPVTSYLYLTEDSIIQRIFNLASRIAKINNLRAAYL